MSGYLLFLSKRSLPKDYFWILLFILILRLEWRIQKALSLGRLGRYSRRRRKTCQPTVESKIGWPSFILHFRLLSPGLESILSAFIWFFICKIIWRWMLIINNRFLSLYDYNFLLVIEKIRKRNSKICGSQILLLASRVILLFWDVNVWSEEFVSIWQ